jgi:hypothetical protein
LAVAAKPPATAPDAILDPIPPAVAEAIVDPISPLVAEAILDPIPAPAADADPTPPLVTEAILDPIPPAVAEAIADPTPPLVTEAILDPISPPIADAIVDPIPPAVAEAQPLPIEPREGQRPVSIPKKFLVWACRRPGCYELFGVPNEEAKKRCCCAGCSKALSRVIERESRLRDRRDVGILPRCRRSPPRSKPRK